MQVKWRGEYSYEIPFDESDACEFEVNVTFNGSQFEGELIDSEFMNITGEVCSVKGLIEGQRIMFVQKFPFQFDELEDGLLYLDKDKEGHEVYFQGEFNELSQFWEGEWEVLEKDEEEEEFEALLDKGSWRMKRLMIDVN